MGNQRYSGGRSSSYVEAIKTCDLYVYRDARLKSGFIIHKKKMDLRTIIGHFIRYAEKSKGYRFVLLIPLRLWNQET